MIETLGFYLLAALWIAWVAVAILSAMQVHKFSRAFLHKRRTAIESHRATNVNSASVRSGRRGRCRWRFHPKRRCT